MAVLSKRVVVTNVPVLLAQGNDGPIHLSTVEGSHSYVLLGGANLSLVNGFRILLGPVPFTFAAMKSSEALWVMALPQTGTPIVVSVLQHLKV